MAWMSHIRKSQIAFVRVAEWNIHKLDRILEIIFMEEDTKCLPCPMTMLWW